jgi:hypothetical protein
MGVLQSVLAGTVGFGTTKARRVAPDGPSIRHCRQGEHLLFVIVGNENSCCSCLVNKGSSFKPRQKLSLHFFKTPAGTWRCQ